MGFYLTKTKMSDETKKRKIRIFDTTLRDGEQSPGYSMNLAEKLRLAKQLERLGVDVIEAGFPVASPDDFKAVEAIAKQCQKLEVCGLCRAVDRDIKATADAIKDAKFPRIHTFIATSDIHLEHKLKISKEQCLEMAVKAVQLSKSLCERVDFSPEDASRTNPEFLYKVLEAVIDAGADVVNIPDTVGYSTPEEFGALIKGIKENVPNIDKAIISTHCHNDLGLAVANSLAGVLNGAGQIECTINGIGERAGNAALEECVMAIHTRPDIYNAETNIVTEEIYPTSRLLMAITSIGVQPNKAIVGKNAFAHEAGIHQHGILANRQTYEIMTPESVGIEKSELVLGKHSGRHALFDRLEKLGWNPKDDEKDRIFEQFKDLADKKKEIFDEDLEMIMLQKELDNPAFTLSRLNARSGLSSIPTAQITLRTRENEEIAETAMGDGQVDAIYKAIDKITKLETQLIDFKIGAASAESDAQGLCKVLIKCNEKIYSGQAAHTDIILACAKAYLEAVNKAFKFNYEHN